MKVSHLLRILIIVLLLPSSVFATTLNQLDSVEIDIASNANNILDTSSSGGAPDDLYLGSILLCDGSDGECGWGEITGSGTAGTMAIFSTGTALGDGIATDDGSTVTHTGDITSTGDFAVNGDDITSTGNIRLDTTSYVRIGDSGTPTTATDGGDLFVTSDTEVDALLYVDSTSTSTFVGTVDVTDLTADDHTIGYIGAIEISSNNDNGIFWDNGASDFFIVKDTSPDLNSVTSDGMKFQAADTDTNGFRYCDTAADCGMYLESFTGQWTLNVDGDLYVGSNVDVSGTATVSGVMDLNGGTTGAAPTTQVVMSNYLDNSGSPSVSHIDLYGGTYGIGVSTNQLNLFSNVQFNMLTNSGTSAMFIDGTGQVGFRNEAPDVWAHVGDTSGTDGELIIEGSDGRQGVFEADDGTNWVHVGSMSDDDFHFTRNDDIKMSLSSSNLITMYEGTSTYDGAIVACSADCTDHGSYFDGWLQSEFGWRVDGNAIYINYDGGDADQFMYSYAGGSTTGARLYWDDSLDAWKTTDDLLTTESWEIWSTNIRCNADGPDADCHMYFYDGGSQTGERLYWDDSGDLFRFYNDISLLGSLTKGSGSFIIPNPDDPSTDIRYYFLEGPQEGAYVHGTANLVNGMATIEIPNHFQLVISAEHMYVQVTPHSINSLGLAVVDISPTQVQIQELRNGTGNYAFDYFLSGVRTGYTEQSAVIPTETYPQDGQVDHNGYFLEFNEGSVEDNATRMFLTESGWLLPDGRINEQTYLDLGIKLPLSKDAMDILVEAGVDSTESELMTRDDFNQLLVETGIEYEPGTVDNTFTLPNVQDRRGQGRGVEQLYQPVGPSDDDIMILEVT